MEQSYLNMFLQGGFIIYILFVISIISLAIIIEQLVFIYKQNAKYDDFFFKLKSTVKSNDEIVKQKVLSKGNPSIVKLIAKLKPDSAANPSHNKQIIEDALVEEVAAQKKRMHALIFIVQLAPLLGILGTVLGLAEAFLSIGDLGGTEKFQMLSQGIGKALSTTIAGLVIAAYTMSGHYFIKYRTSKSISALSKHIEDYIQTISAKNEN
ncbi:MAG: MotA/TolQ/ExbB proton channel family protein [Ignavibacteria bacterium]|nr:MotA/TolQ/ExbB proton channel family protein [Ignavibacteria bacterium]